MIVSEGKQLYLRWIAANALAELLGLGATFVLDILIFTRLGDPRNVLAAAGMILLTTATGAVEGVVVGLLQWSVLRRTFPHIARRAWLAATLAGALAAWFLGSLPSTLIGLGGAGQAGSSQEPETWLILLLAAGMGLVLGVILALPQWRVLRRRGPARRAWVWLPANAAAWALGMPLIFAAVDVAYGTGTTAGAIGVMAVALALTGAVVGAVHGLALVRLAGREHPAG